MDLDIPATNGLVKSIVVNNNLTIILIPNLDAEGIIPARVIIFGPDHELEQLPIGRSITINSASTFVFSITATLDNNQPIVFVAVEVQITSGEVELRVTGRHTFSSLILGDKTKVSFTFGLSANGVKLAPASFGPNPAATRNEAAVGVVDDDELSGGGVASAPIFIGHGDGDLVDASFGVGLVSTDTGAAADGARLRSAAIVVIDGAGVRFVFATGRVAEGGAGVDWLSDDVDRVNGYGNGIHSGIHVVDGQHEAGLSRAAVAVIGVNGHGLALGRAIAAVEGPGPGAIIVDHTANAGAQGDAVTVHITNGTGIVGCLAFIHAHFTIVA